jgi:C1A family cysteine protease
MTHAYGWRPELPDHRDRLFGDHRVVRPLKDLPAKVDLHDLERPIDTQGMQGSCVAQSISANFEMVRAKDFGAGNPGDAFDASRAFIYYEARKRQGWEREDSGCYIRDGVRVCVEQGVPIEFNFPYDPAVYDQAPPAEVYGQARHFQVTEYLRLRNRYVEELLTCLADGYSFVGGLTLYESFESDAVARTGMVPMPKRRERMLGGHAVCFTGYDLKAERFRVRNSWGTGWGDGGYFYLPFNYAESEYLAADFWSLRALEPPF